VHAKASMKNLDLRETLSKKRPEYEFNNDRPMLLALYILFFIVATALILIARYYYNETRELLKTGIGTKAIVSEIITVEDSDGKSYKPVFTFLDEDGHPVSFENPVTSNPVVWRLGEEVSVIYDPSMPSIAKVVSYWGLFRVSIICTMIAAPFLVVSLGYFFFLFWIDRQ
jgi:hypothetical protein